MLTWFQIWILTIYPIARIVRISQFSGEVLSLQEDDPWPEGKKGPNVWQFRPLERLSFPPILW